MTNFKGLMLEMRECLDEALETNTYNSNGYRNSPVNIKGFLLRLLNKDKYNNLLTRLSEAQKALPEGLDEAVMGLNGFELRPTNELSIDEEWYPVNEVEMQKIYIAATMLRDMFKEDTYNDN